jgi:hypothetical protein
VQENFPLEEVVIVVPMNVPTVHEVGARSTPPKETVAPALSVNPLPATIMELPTGPCPGVTEMDTGVTVKIAVAVLVPSEATIDWAPFGTDGIVTVHEKLPLGSEEHTPLAETPSSLKEIGWDAAKPVPVAVVVLPTIPVMGLRTRTAPTVNEADALFVPSEATIDWAPWGTAGIVTVQVKLPVPSEEQDDGAATPASVKVIELPGK